MDITTSSTNSPLVEHPLQNTGILADQVEKLHKKKRYTKEQVLENIEKEYKLGTIFTKDQFAKSLQHFFLLDDERDSLLIERIFQLTDSDHNNIIDYKEYATLLSLLYASTSEEKLYFVFKAFDLNGDGFLSRDEFLQILSLLWTNGICRELFDFAIDERKLYGQEVFADSFFKEADINKDNLISFEEYKAVSTKYTHKTNDHKLKILETQTGGHVDSFRKLPNGRIKKTSNKIETDFYLNMESLYPFMKQFAPTFYSISSEDGKKWIEIEDITYLMQKPNVMDIKMGTSSAGEDASEEKRLEMEKKDKNSTTVSLGLRITGMKVFKETTNEYVQFTKSWGRKVTKETIHEALSNYFHNGHVFRTDVLSAFLQELKEFQNWIKLQDKLRFYSSSLLFAYDSKASTPKFKIKMIDFAHVFPISEPNGRDFGYITGINNLISFFEILFKSKSN